MIKKGLSPVYDENTRIMFVGTFPSEISLDKNEYYGNHSNQFWSLLGDILGTKLKNMEYSVRLRFILDNGIGLWDTIKECSRETSADLKIINPVFNDFSILGCQISYIFTTSKNAYNLLGNCNIPSNVYKNFLASPSKARAMKYEDKLDDWKNKLKNII